MPRIGVKFLVGPSAMKKILPLPSLSYLNEAFTYDETSKSCLRWRRRPLSHFATVGAGALIGSRDAGKEAGHKQGKENEFYW